MHSFLFSMLLVMLPPAVVQTEEPARAEPLEVSIEPKSPVEGDLVVIRLKGAPKSAVWFLGRVAEKQGEAVVLAPAPFRGDLNDGGRKLVLAAPLLPPGVKSQEFALYCVADGQPIQVTLPVTARGAKPSPPLPDPPKPPAVDPWVTELAGKFAGTKDQAKLLAAVYRDAVKEATNPANVTFADLAAGIKATIDNCEGLGPTACQVVREAVRDRVVLKAPPQFADLTSGDRDAIASVYGLAAEAMDRCSN